VGVSLPLVPIVVVAIAMAAACTDLATRRIPNVLTFGAAALALAFHGIDGGARGVGFALGGWLVGAAVFFPVFLLGGMGAGDVKLVAAIGSWLGPLGALQVAAGSAIAGGVVAVLVTLRARYFRTALANLAGLFSHWRVAGLRPMPDLTLASSRGPRLAYAVPILIGTLGALWLG
jgi:prepilin peptidase CpaA